MKKAIALILALVMVFALAACGGDSSSSGSTGGETEKLKIGFSNGFSGNAWRALMLESLKQEAAKYDDVELIVVDGQNDNSKQVSDIESLISMGCDGIMCIPNSPEAVEPVLKEARNQGITVCVFNLALNDEEAYDIYLGTDMKQKGYEYSKAFLEAIGCEGNIVQFGGIAGNSATAMCLEGFEEACADLGADVNVLAYNDCDWSEDKAKMIMADLLNAYDDIDGVWCDGGGSAAGAAKAMLEAGRELVPMCGDDYNGLFKLYLEQKDDHPNFDIFTISEPTWQSREAFKLLYASLTGETVEKTNLFLPDMITGAEAENFVQWDLPYALYVDNDVEFDALKAIMDANS